MQAITTKYPGPTNTRGARIQARIGDIRVTVPYAHELSGVHVHFEAVKKLCEKQGYKNRSIVYAISNEGYTFVFSKCSNELSV